jgi:hypothetical protein
LIKRCYLVEVIEVAKPSQGRFDGVYGMQEFTAEELFALADQYEAHIIAPANTDDPKWLRRRADRIRRVAIAKQSALEQKARERRAR